MTIAPGPVSRPLPNGYWVVPGRLLASEYPGARDPAEAAGKLARLLEAGVTHFVDLTEPGELVPYDGRLADAAAARGRRAVYTRVPIRDGEVPATPAVMVRVLDAIDAGLATGGAVVVHCWGGIGCTGTAVGCWLVRQGASGDEALVRIAACWTVMEKRHRAPRSPETVTQADYIRTWPRP